MDIFNEVVEKGAWLTVPQSSNIVKFRYLKESATLIVQFKSGQHYKYDGVDAGLVSNFINSSSKGKFFYNSIRKKFIGIHCDAEGKSINTLTS